MSAVTKIHASKQPRRPHYIEAWAERRGLKQIDLAHELHADRGLVSRWYAGACPGADWQERLAAYFGIEPESLFRDPDEDWLRRFFEGRRRDEIERIKLTLETAFPKQASAGERGGAR